MFRHFTCKIPSPYNHVFDVNNPPINRSQNARVCINVRGSDPPPRLDMYVDGVSQLCWYFLICMLSYLLTLILSHT